MRFATCPELWGFTGALQRDIFNESAGVADLAQSILGVDLLRPGFERQLSLQEGRIEDLESVDRVAKQVLVKPILPIKDPRRPAVRVHFRDEPNIPLFVGEDAGWPDRPWALSGFGKNCVEFHDG